LPAGPTLMLKLVLQIICINASITIISVRGIPGGQCVFILKGHSRFSPEIGGIGSLIVGLHLRNLGLHGLLLAGLGFVMRWVMWPDLFSGLVCLTDWPGRWSSLGLRIVSCPSWAFGPIYYLVGIFPNNLYNFYILLKMMMPTDFYNKHNNH